MTDNRLVQDRSSQQRMLQYDMWPDWRTAISWTGANAGMQNYPDVLYQKRFAQR